MSIMLNRRATLVAGAGLLGAGWLPASARAAGWPERAITVAMAAPAGGATDIGVRPILEHMKGMLGAPAIAAQDMSGAGGIQALDYVLKQPADGYTWLGANDVIEAFPSYDRVEFDWRNFDFWMAAGTACAIVVPTSSKIERFDQFLEEVNAKPNEYAMSSTPSGTIWSNAAVYLKDKLGLKFRLANYKGGGPAVRAVLAGETHFGSIGVTPTVNFVKAGQLRCLAAWTPDDWATAGVVIPSIKRFVKDPILEKTLPWTNIHGIAVRKGVPEDILKKMDAAFAAAMADPAREKLDAENAFFPFRVGRDKANELMGERTALQAYIIEVILKDHKKTRDELKIKKIEDA